MTKDRKTENDIILRDATEKDAAQILTIYAPYVEHTAITFELEIPSIEEMRDRIAGTIKSGFPYLVACVKGEIVGYGYAGKFHPRAAYDHCAEMTVYLKDEVKGRGIGRRIYEEIERRLLQMGKLNAYACIARTEVEDAHLTNASICFHEALGYRIVGRFTKCGYKFDTWYDMVWMEKMLGEHRAQKISDKECGKMCP